MKPVLRSLNIDAIQTNNPPIFKIGLIPKLDFDPSLIFLFDSKKRGPWYTHIKKCIDINLIKCAIIWNKDCSISLISRFMFSWKNRGIKT